MKKWEIWKSAKPFTWRTRKINLKQTPKGLVEDRTLTKEERERCNKLHRRYLTRAEARRVCVDMKRQNIVCCVRKRKPIEA